MKIVHLSKYYKPDAGGIESVVLCLATGAVQAGHQVDVICFAHHAAAGDVLIDGVTVKRVPTTALKASQPLGWKYFQKALGSARDADILHVHTPNMVAAACTLLFSKRLKVVVHWHADVLQKGWLGRAFAPLEAALLRRSDLIIATSEIYANASPLLIRFQSKVRVIPIGIADPTIAGLTPPPQSIVRIEDALQGKRVIIAVGRLVPYKGFGVLVEAALHLDHDVHVVIVGGGPIEPELQASVQALGLAQRVHLAGRVDEALLLALFRRADVFCLPSTERSEAFGVVLLEAMAFSLPIIATEIPGSGVPWVNCSEVSGLNVPVGNPAALAEACMKILDSLELRQRLSAGARQRFVSEFTDARFVQRVSQLYNDLLGR